VERVVDGDTVVLDGGEKVRLLGIDTPETVDPRRPVERFGKEASVFARSLLQGRRVRVETDVEPRDRYGRTLAYLYLEDGTFVNLRLVEEGYASASRHPPNVRHAGLLRDAEKRAREMGRGLWSDRGRAKGFER
jgi:micrococcal nuclease